METWEEGTVAREDGDLRNAASLWGKQPSLHLELPRLWGLRGLRGGSLERAVLELSPPPLASRLLEHAASQQKQRELLGHRAPAETVSEGLTLLDAGTICPACATASRRPSSLSHTTWHQHRKVGAPIPSPNHFQSAGTWTWLAHTCNASSLVDEVRKQL